MRTNTTVFIAADSYSGNNARRLFSLSNSEHQSISRECIIDLVEGSGRICELDTAPITKDEDAIHTSA